MDVVTLTNLGTSAAISAACAWAVMSHAVRDGVVIKLGLVAMSLGHAMVAFQLADGIGPTDLLALNRARFVCNAGFIVVVLGYVWRRRRGQTLADIVPFLDR